MRRITLFLIVSVMFPALLYGKGGGIITMTTSADSVSFLLKGSITVTVDWGDGSEKETAEVEFPRYDDELPLAICHRYSGTATRTITVTGDNITDLICWNMGLTALDVSRNTALAKLWCSGNPLTALNVNRNTVLEHLDCSRTRLTALDVSRNTALTLLHCSDNQLTVLNVSRNTALKGLYCNNNQLTALDVSRNTALRRLSLNGNRLTALDVGNNTALVELWCIGNQFTTAALNELFGTLHGNAVMPDEGEIKVTKLIEKTDNPGSTDCNPGIAEAKGWSVDVECAMIWQVGH